MKKSVRSIVAFVVLLTMVLSILSPISAITVENTNKTTVLLNAEKQSALSSDIPISERYHAIENGYRGKYDLQEGIFGHQSSQQKNKNAVYFYSDGYFEDTPDIYNPSLSTMSLALSLSAFNAQYTDFDLTLPNGEYSNLFRHSKMLMSDIGINDKDIYVNDSFDIAPTDNTIGMIMGAKKILIEDKDYILIPIAVRGGDYKAEWASNATLGKNGEAYGFSSSATKVMEQIEAYITSNSSFDIPSAIDEGKVKFWIVGYSRGGAVANIAAKRLTDIYGKQGNSIYSYTFEAPSGGVDAEEMNESWTYNGIYANIHNIINPSDLIPNIPPKQMGFKRYGVDHYSPGTDVGAIKTTTYVTPTGITVTSHSDNEAYEVGEENYNQRRENMLHYLSDIDSSIVFSDEFSIVNIDIMQVLSGGELFESVESGQNATSAEWIKCFIEDLQKWAANGTMSRGKYDNGDYENDYRAFYTSNNEFAGKNHVTVEVALQNILKLIFTYQYDEEFATALMHRGISLISDYMNILDFYLNVIKKWDKLSKSNQVKYLDKIWNGLDGDLKLPDGTTVKKISDLDRKSVV